LPIGEHEELSGARRQLCSSPDRAGGVSATGSSGTRRKRERETRTSIQWQV
jgi:hypothetical protein